MVVPGLRPPPPPLPLLPQPVATAITANSTIANVTNPARFCGAIPSRKRHAMKATTSPTRSQLGPSGFQTPLAAVVLTVSVVVLLIIVLDKGTGFVLNEHVGVSLKLAGVTAQVIVTGSEAVIFDPLTVMTDVPD